MRATILAAMAACSLLAAPAVAQDRVEPQTVADRGEGRPGERLRSRMAERAQGTEEEVAEAMQFMTEHSPNRVRAMEALPESGASRRGVMAFVLARYRALQAVKEEDPRLYDIKVKQVESEDELYGLLAPTRTISERERMRDKIRIATKAMIEQNIAEREHRLERLRQQLQREEQKVNADRSQMEARVDARAQVLIQEGASALRRDLLRHDFREGRFGGPTTKPADKQ